MGTAGTADRRSTAWLVDAGSRYRNGPQGHGIPTAWRQSTNSQGRRTDSAHSPARFGGRRLVADRRRRSDLAPRPNHLSRSRNFEDSARVRRCRGSRSSRPHRACRCAPLYDSVRQVRTRGQDPYRLPQKQPHEHVGVCVLPSSAARSDGIDAAQVEPQLADAPSRCTILTAPRRLARVGSDAWENYWECGQTISTAALAAVKRL